FALRTSLRDSRLNMSAHRIHGSFVHVPRQAPQDGRVCVWHDSVPKVEYMTRPTCGTVEDIARRGLRPLPRPEQDGRIQVPLHATIVADERPTAVERDPPVEADHVAARLGHAHEHGGRPRPEMDRRYLDRPENP